MEGGVIDRAVVAIGYAYDAAGERSVKMGLNRVATGVAAVTAAWAASALEAAHAAHAAADAGKVLGMSAEDYTRWSYVVERTGSSLEALRTGLITLQRQMGAAKTGTGPAAEALRELGLPAFLKTSGGKGLHVVVPIKRLRDWDSSKAFSQAVVQHLARTIPQRFVAKSGPKNRVGKIFVDYLRNGRGATTVAAWSARARPGLGVSVPVAWSELPTITSGAHWTVTNIEERLRVGNAPWQGYAKAAVALGAAERALGASARG